MKIEIHAPDMPSVVVSLLLAVLALIGYFVDSSFTFFIAMFAYIVGALASWSKSKREVDFDSCVSEETRI